MRRKRDELHKASALKVLPQKIFEPLQYGICSQICLKEINSRYIKPFVQFWSKLRTKLFKSLSTSSHLIATESNQSGLCAFKVPKKLVHRQHSKLHQRPFLLRIRIFGLSEGFFSIEGYLICLFELIIDCMLFTGNPHRRKC